MFILFCKTRYVNLQVIVLNRMVVTVIPLVMFTYVVILLEALRRVKVARRNVNSTLLCLFNNLSLSLIVFICYSTQRENEDEELCSVFVPTNHLYIGDIFLVNSKEIIRPNLSIREGIG